jgi:predicted metal-dependent peptidase
MTNNTVSDDDKVVRKYKKVRLDLMRSGPFVELGPVLRLGKQRIVKGYPTASTDGVNETYGYEFVNALEERQLAFVVVHETMHKVCRHLVTYNKLWKENATLTNMACDYWINGKLDNIAKADAKSKIEMVTITQALLDILDERTKDALAQEGKGIGSVFGLLDHRFDGMSVKQIYDILKQEAKDKGEGGGEGEGGFDHHDWESAEGMTKEEVEEMREELERAVREGQMAAKKAGRGKGSHDLGLEELLAPKIDWRAHLREFVKATCRKMEVSTWRRPNRRFLHQGIIMPTMQGKSIKSLGGFVDVSGSMLGGPECPYIKVMSEVDGLIKQLQIETFHLIYWDGWVCKHETYTQATLAGWKESTRPSGGGGTDPSCIPPYLKEHNIKVDAAIILTDGDVCGWGEWTIPTLWAITGKNVAPVGKTIHIED